jgi:hypothetical protein
MNPDTASKIICSALDEFCIPAALVDLVKNRFAGYNKTFQEATDPSGKILSTKSPDDLITMLPESSSASVKSTAADRVHLRSCLVQGARGEVPRTGHCFLRQDDLLLLFLDTAEEDAGRKEFATGKLIGRQMERERMKKEFHDAVSPEILAAAFAAESLTARLQAAGSEHTTESKALSQRLSNLITNLQTALNEEIKNDVSSKSSST